MGLRIYEIVVGFFEMAGFLLEAYWRFLEEWSWKLLAV